LLPPVWEPLLQAIRLAARTELPDIPRELEVQERRIGFQLTRLELDLTGVVLALNDLTDVTRAERVLAWGEMARQVAHEIKNPLTPLRLGIQHLRRVYRDRSAEFETTLENTSTRILAEIDRLDTIARAFSRFGAPAESAAPLELLDISAAAAEVVQLYRLGEDGTRVELRSSGQAHAVGRKDEVKEVLVNLIENARNAGARRVIVEVASGLLAVEDNGPGMEAEQLARLFEPRFSTTTTGSGLGLPIVRRLVESWGGAITVDSAIGRGTRVSLTLLSDAV
jgi:two-component system nitrogen regulation sensor histidine kinase NtrY